MKYLSRSDPLKCHGLPLVLACMMSLASVPTHAQGNSNAAKFYEDALVRYEKKDLEGAAIQLKNALQVDPSALPVQLLLGKVLLKTGEVAAAEVALTEALRLGVNRAEVVLMLAQAFLAQGKHRLMLDQATFNPAGLPAPTQVQLYLLRSVAQADLGDVRNALRSIDDARAIDSRSPDVWLAEVPIRIRARQFKEATEAVDKALALTPKSAEGLYQRGSVLHVQGNLRAALEAYDRAIQIDPDHVEGRVARAGIYIDVGRYSDAGKDLAELRRLAPREPRGSYMRALLSEREGNANATREALKEVTELLDPVPMEFIRFRPQVLMLNGLSHFGLNQREKAKQYLEAFYKVQSNSPVSKLLARLYLEDKNPALAATVLEAYLKAQPGDGQAVTLLAGAHMALGRPSKAAALMQEALKKQDDPSFHTALGLSLIGGGQTAGGLAALETAYKKDPRQTPAGIALVQLYLQAGQSRKAIPVAEGLLKLQPANAGFHNLLGMALGQSGNVAAARTSFERALQLKSNLTPAAVNLARLEIAAKSFDSATTRLNEVLKTEPRNGEAMFELAIVADRKGQPEEAVRWLEKARETADQKELRWGLALVDLHLQYSRVGPALEAAKLASSKAPDDLRTLLAYGRAQLANGDRIGAKNTLTGATRFAEFDPSRQVEIAKLQLAARNPSGAVYSLEKALTSKPDYLPAQALMCEAELAQGDTQRAEKRAKDISAQHPKRAVGARLLGDIAMARGQSAAAIEQYRRAHQIEPTTNTLLRLFGALATQDTGKPALQLAEQWIKANPKDVVVRKALADAHARSGNFAAAKLAYEAALRLDSTNGELLNNLANVQLRLKDPAAIKTAEAALANAPGNPFAIDTLGWALFLNGQTDRALQLLRDARLRQPDNPDIRYHLAAVLAQTGRKGEAKEELDAALKARGGFESKQDAESLLRSLQ